MSDMGMRSLFLSLLDAAGLKKTLTSFIATVVSFGVNDVAQLIAVSIGILSGCMAIRHYAVATQLSKARLARFRMRKQKGIKP